MLLIASGERLFKITVKPLLYTFLSGSVLGIASGSRECEFPLNLLILSILSTCGGLNLQWHFLFSDSLPAVLFTLSSWGNS